MRRERILRFARVHIKAEAAWSDVDNVDIAAAEMKLLTHLGKCESITFITPKGSPGNPLNDNDQRDKFISLVEPNLREHRSEELLKEIRNIDATRNENLLQCAYP